MAKNTTLYSNNARSTLASAITTSSGTITVASAVGFPAIPGAGYEFYVTLDDNVNIEIVKVTGVSGNTLTGCIRGQEGTTARAFNVGAKVENRLTAGNLNVMARLQDRLLDVATIESLSAPAETDGNSRLCASTDPSGMPVIAIVSGTKWRLLNYPDVIRVGTAGAGATSTSLTIAGIGSQLIDTAAKTYVLQFTSGPNLGQLRFLTVAAGAVSWATAMPGAIGASDTFEIYRSAVASKMPTGGNSDRIFFENEATIWTNYSIPSGKNASTAGPVSIASGVTVTVPSGSGWTII